MQSLAMCFPAWEASPHKLKHRKLGSEAEGKDEEEEMD